MKSTILLFLFPLFSNDVFCADVKEPVSVMVGDSVTLHINTKIQIADVIEWSFGQKPIAMIDEGSITITASDENLKDRLQLVKQTGDLKIINTKTTDSGDYKLDITRASRTEESVTMTFGVSVVPAVVPAAAVKSVMVGDSVTLYAGLTEIQRDVVIQWRFGQQKSLVAKINRAAGIFNTFDGPNERFRDRLDLNNQTGSLIITNTRTEDTGDYEVEISNTISRHTTHHTQSFIVTVSDALKSVLVKKGDPVTLQITEIQKDDLIQWMFEDTVLAEINKADLRFYTYDGPDERFRGRLQLDHQTGSLTITNTRTTHSGLYKLKIRSSRDIINLRFFVTVFDALKSVLVTEGKTIILKTITEIQKDDLIQWMFEDTVLAEINKADLRFYTSDGPDERFRDRLQLDHQTGSLTITNTRTTHSGLYEVKIRSSRRTINLRFFVTVFAVPDSGLSPGEIAGIVVGVLLGVMGAAGAAGVIYYHSKRSRGSVFVVILLAAAVTVVLAVGLIYNPQSPSPGEIAGIVGVVLMGAAFTAGAAGVIYYHSKRSRGSAVSSPGVAEIVVILLAAAVTAAVFVVYYGRKISKLNRQISDLLSGSDTDSGSAVSSPGVAEIVVILLAAAVTVAVAVFVVYYGCKISKLNRQKDIHIENEPSQIQLSMENKYEAEDIENVSMKNLDGDEEERRENLLQL